MQLATPNSRFPGAFVRLWPALGTVGWVVALTGFAIHGYPITNAAPQQLVKWTSSTDMARFTIGVEIEAIGILVFVFFLAWLCDLMRRSGEVAWLLALALISVVAGAAVSIAANGIWMALLESAKRGVAPESLASIRDIAPEVFNASNLLLPPALFAIGLALLGRTALPRWLAWAVLAIGVLMLAPPLVYPMSLAFVIWVAAVSVFFLIRPVPLLPEPATAA